MNHIQQELPVTVFSKLPAIKGNALVLAINHEPLSYQDCLAIYRRDLNHNNDRESIAYAYISPQGNNQFNLHVFQHGHKIHCCGHALLAAADYLLASYNLSSLTLNRDIRAFYNQNQQTVIHLPRLKSYVCPQQSWHEALIRECDLPVFHFPPHQTQSDSGYLLVEIDGNIELSKLTVNLELLCQKSHRALIIFNRVDKPDCDIHLRYFAPQYGNDEDKATGSAVRVVGDYLALKYNISQFTIEQRSTSGGLIFAGVHTDTVAISGHIHYG